MEYLEGNLQTKSASGFNAWNLAGQNAPTFTMYAQDILVNWARKNEQKKHSKNELWTGLQKILQCCKYDFEHVPGYTV